MLPLRRGRPISARASAPQSFAEAADAHLDGVYRYLRRMTRDPDLADDLTSETFERALKAWRRYDPEKAPALVWLVAIARRVAFDHTRSERRRRAREARYAAGDAQSTPPPAEPAELPAEVIDALAGLSDLEREIVALRVLLDVDGNETAELLGITPSACSTHLHRAMTKLRRHLSDG